MDNAMSITEANDVEARYYAMLHTKTTAKEWHDMALELEDAADRLLCIDADHRKACLREKAEDCHEASLKAARGSHEIYPRKAAR